MKQRESELQGQNLVEIVIILAVIVIAGVVVLTFLGFNVNNLFTSSHTKYQEYKPFEWNNGATYTPIKAGDLKGTESKPVSKCSGGMCSVDYGSFVLNGIPENFTEFVQTGGTSGGQDKLVELILQIAQQLEEKGDAAGAKQFRDLANLNHFIADIQKETENMAKSCQSDANPAACFKNKLESPVSISLPEKVADLLPDYALYHPDNFQAFLKMNTQIGVRRSDLLTGYSYLPAKFNTTYPTFQALDIYDNIQNNANYSSTLKGVATDLLKQIDTLATNLCTQAQATASPGQPITTSNIDLVTGAIISKVTLTSNDGMNDIIKPNYTFNTDLRSQLICVKGQNDDTGHACH